MAVKPRPLGLRFYRSEGTPMLHLYSAVLLAVIAANALAVLLAVAIALNGRKRNHWLSAWNSQFPSYVAPDAVTSEGICVMPSSGTPRW